MIKLSDYVMEFLASAGVKHLFMLTGGACMHLVDSAGRHPDRVAVHRIGQEFHTC